MKYDYGHIEHFLVSGCGSEIRIFEAWKSCEYYKDVGLLSELNHNIFFFRRKKSKRVVHTY